MEANDELLHTAAEQGQLDVVKTAVAAGANLESKNRVDMTALTNSSLAGQFHVAQFLIDSGAKVTNDLMSSLAMKVNILQENNEAGMVTDEGLAEWQRFHRFIRRARLKQDLPEIFAALKSKETDTQAAALDALETAANAGFDISPVLADLAGFLNAENSKARSTAAAALAIFHIAKKNWGELQKLCAFSDEAIQLSVMSALVDASKNEGDLSPVLPQIIHYLGSPSEDVRHDAPIVIGYLATHGFETVSAVTPLRAMLDEGVVDMRQIACWAFYRMAKYGKVDISAALPRIKELASDEADSVKNLADEILAVV